MNFKRFVKRLPDEYQELSYIQNNRDEYIDSGLLGSDLYGCEIETKMMIWASDNNNFALNGAYESGKTAQLGLVTTDANTVRVSANFGFQDALSVTGIERNKYTTIYVSDGLQKVDGQQVATYNYGSLITSFPFLILARKESSSISVAKYVKMAYFWIKKNGVYIRNYIPAKRLSDNICGLYDLANNTFSPSLNGNFTGGEVVNPEWTDIPYYIHNTSTDTITTLPAVLYPTGATATVGLKGQTLQSSIPSPTSPVMPEGCGDLETSGAKAGQYKIPISSANTTTNVYLGEVQTMRQIKKLVFDGTEDWMMNADGWFYLASVSDDYLRSEGNITSTCSHYPTYKQSSAIVQLPDDYTGFSWGSAQRLYLKDTSHRNDLSSFKQWVASQYAAGTPVTVWYVLATEETGIVNEPLMKIGDYADTVSNVSIPVTAGGDTISVGTTVQPSEVTVNYKGWHPVANVHERESGAWT